MYSWEPEGILIEIQAKRKLMIDSANETGLTSESTVRYSQELDELIVAYQKAGRAAMNSNLRIVNRKLKKYYSPMKMRAYIFNGAAPVQASM
ncbi:aspartyl-phosphate phosphatase Spo0E family protein [Neobacillus notoginsengisoli]|uniref:Aspartyl-phosphate phosphatase Spo0E family protein n=2 Tax=Neobacillus notoginsengisoli TaxID=1578198 RepID=A0A417YFH7_9BACI|nr:aspartyl-phosphate phosphatase Spo0E family protein [Neobacillus notoginsengisoli]